VSEYPAMSASPSAHSHTCGNPRWRNLRRTHLLVAVAGALLLLGAGGRLAAQSGSKGPPNALQGFSQNHNEPVHIEAATLEVRDKEKVATFSGDVRVRQGDTNMRCKTLVVFYEQNAFADNSPTLAAADPGPAGQQRIKKLEARGGVVVTQKDQTATGNLGVFDMQTNTVTLTGHVVMTQGKNVVRGDRLVVNLTSGVSRVESGKNGHGRVQGLFLPEGNGPAALKPGANGQSLPLPMQPFHR